MLVFVARGFCAERAEEKEGGEEVDIRTAEKIDEREDETRKRRSRKRIT